MKMIKVLQKVDVEAAGKLSDSDSSISDGTLKVYHRLKAIIYLSGFVLLGVFFNSCFAGYVASEPIYIDVARPHSPGNGYIWIDGDWAYNRQSHIYVQRSGYWQQPVQNRTFIPGHWQSTPHGKSWSKGYYQKQGRQGDNRRK